MNFKYPISKEDGTDYNAEELYAILSKEKSGHYLLGNHQFWHGGIHFSTETVKQCVLKQPIRCIADGEVIAYRINKIYKSSKLNNTILKYSSSFCLVKHEYESPAEPIKIPEKDPTKLNEDWQNKKIETLATGFSSYSDEAYNNKKLMPKGLKLEILHVNDTTKEIRNTEYYLAKAKVLEAIEANTTNNTGAYNKDEELWFAAFKKDGSLQSSVRQETDLFKQTDSTDATTEDKKESEETSKSPEAKTNKLTFYSLYMHLLPYDEYPVQEEEIKQQAKIIASNLRARDKIIGDENAQVIGKISKDTVVNILSVSEDKSGNNYCAKVTIFENSGKITSINETTKKEEQVTPPADGFWIVLKDKQTNNGEITWREYAKELPVPKRMYPKYWAKQVTAKVTASELNVRQAPGADSDVAGEPLGVRLKIDDEVTYDNSKVKSLKINGKAYQMAECKLIKDKAEFTEKGITSFWACIESKFMTVIKAEPGTFDTVDITNMKISAGEPVGYLGLYEVPNSPTGGKSDSPKKQVHIEVFTVASEEELKKFLDNEAGLTIGRQYIKIPKGTVLEKQEAGTNGTSDVALNSTWQNKEIETLANNFASYASEGLGAAGKKRMPKGLKLKILQVKDTTNKIGKSNYYIAKAKVLEDIKADIAGTNDYKKDEEIWFAAFTADKKITYINNQKTNLFKDVTPTSLITIINQGIETIKQLNQLMNTYHITHFEHIVSSDKAKLVNDKYLVTFYENGQSITGYVAQDKIQKISQYNLTELGFKVIKEENANADGNVSTSKEGLIDQEKMTPFFQDLCKEIDSKENGGDGDGKLSLPELRNALKNPMLNEKWSKLIAYHPTEWQAKGDDLKWKNLFTYILSSISEPLLRNHEKERITNLVFWDEVPDLKGKKAAFHFHPVAFVEYLLQQIQGIGIGWARSPFAELLGRVESKNDYSAYNRTFHTKPKVRSYYNTNLTSMTIKEIQEKQVAREMFATGRYQIITETLESAVKALKLDTSLIYDQKLQDRIFEEYFIKIKRPEIINYLEGDGDVEDAIYAWAKEWASAGVRKGKVIHRNKIAAFEGSSFYQGDGYNSAHIMPDEMVRVLEESKAKSSLYSGKGQDTDTTSNMDNQNTELSGRNWVSRFPTSINTTDLISPFRENVDAFISALRAAGATVSISATYRPPKRAYLMHWAYKIAHEGQDPRTIPPHEGININWVHTDDQGNYSKTKSVKAAVEMSNAYSIAHRPSLTSNHVRRKAIDMNITWTGTLNIVNAQGVTVAIRSTPRTGAGNSDLHTVGRGYGVLKLVSDAPHWSANGK